MSTRLREEIVRELSNNTPANEIQNQVNQIISDFAATKGMRATSNKFSNMPPIISVQNFTKHYKGREKPAVSDLNFTVHEGEFHAFIGKNGAGKTTTMKSLVGAYATWQGNIYIGQHLNTTIEAKRLIGYIPEKAVFPSNFTTTQYLVSMAKMSGLNPWQAKRFAHDKLVEIGMEKYANLKPSTFSSGQKKKILIAQALVHNPKVLILDEPAANLDPVARKELFDLLVQLKNKGTAIFISSHILAEIGKYVDTVTILDSGNIVYSAPVAHQYELESLYFQYVKSQD